MTQRHAAIQLSSQGKTLMKGENIQYIYINSKHKNQLCRVVPVLKDEKEDVVIPYLSISYEKQPVIFTQIS